MIMKCHWCLMTGDLAEAPAEGTLHTPCCGIPVQMQMLTCAPALAAQSRRASAAYTDQHDSDTGRATGLQQELHPEPSTPWCLITG